MGSEWRRCKWGDISTLEYGKSFRDYRETEGRYRVYGTNGPIGWHDKPLCTHSGVIIGRKGAYRGVHYSPDPFFVIDTAFYLEPKEEMDVRWAYYCLLTYNINAMDSGSAIPSTSREAFYNLPVQIPPLPEQRAIAHILGALDDKIELNRQMNQTLEAIARALFKSWFVDFDPVRANAKELTQAAQETQRAQTLASLASFASFALTPALAALFPDEFVESELGEIPKGWEVRSLDQIADFLNGLACQKYPPEKGEESLPVIKIRELRQGFTENADYATVNVPEEYIVEDGDVLFSWSGSLLVDIWTYGKGLLNQHLFKVTSNTYPKWFFYYWTDHHLNEFQRIAADKATTMGHIKRHHLSDAKVCVPDNTVMRIADEQIAPLFDRRIQVQLESRTLAALRDTLLPKLISGELRVPEALM